MSILGKLHEISFYGLVMTVIALVTNKITVSELISARAQVGSFPELFLCVLFWCTVLFIPIAIVGAFATKYADDGEGLSFMSDNLFVIFFAHIAEEILGLVRTPVWFLRDLFSGELSFWGVFDTVTYVIELVFFVIGSFIIILLTINYIYFFIIFF